MARQIAKTFCARMDHGGCGLRVHIENGKVVRIEGDPESLHSRGFVCAKGRAQPEKLNHPDRLKFPLLRTGARGAGNWKRISWEEALTRLAEAVATTIARWSPNAACFGQGTPKGLETYLMMRLANVLKIPNLLTPGSVCHMPREAAAVLTCGFFPVPDYDHPPAGIIVWGSNLLDTNEEGVLGVRLRAALTKGAKLVVVDPQKTQLAAKADLWIRPKPGTDLALALGIAKVLVEENLADQAFVAKWILGFDRLRNHLGDYGLDKISRITWVPVEQITQAARLYSLAKPACIQWGNALEQTPHSFQTARALLTLMALSGNLGAPGGNVERPEPPLLKLSDFVLSKIFREKRQNMIRSEFRAASMMGFVPSQLILNAALTGDSGRIRTMFLQGTNPLVSHPDAVHTRQAIKQLDFLAVSEVFMTPTAQMADLVLPAATHFEFDDIGHYGFRHGYVLARPKIVEPPADCWPDSKILNEVGKRLGYAEFFWEDVRACLDEIVEPAGMTYRDFATIGMLKGNWVSTAFTSGKLDTPSGKVEIYCRRLENWGYDPLPTYPEKMDGLDEFALCEAFPMILTSAKDPFSFHSAYRNLPTLRRLSPDPVVCVHPDTAEQLGLTEGDWASIGTERGTIRQRVKLAADLDHRVAVASAGWWFPERGDLELSGWKTSNLNILTQADKACDPAMGTPMLRGIPCWMRPVPKTEPCNGEAKTGRQPGV